MGAAEDSAQEKADVARLYINDKTVPWWTDNPVITWPARYMLHKYSGIPAEEIDKVVMDLREKAWDTFPYPCVSHLDFLDFQISHRNLLYPRLVEQLKSGSKMLDIACCMGHDIRKLVFDGVPGENLVGIELQQGFLDLGFELFRDKDHLKAKFLQGSVTEDGGLWDELYGKFDIVHLGMFLHMWTYEEQIDVLKRAIKCLKPEVGVKIIGTKVGSVDGRIEDWLGKKIPAHNIETFKAFVDDAGKRTETKWEVDSELDHRYSKFNGRDTWANERMRRLTFELTRVE
ncbi:methyltransferase domain-containing protein [Cercophora newfieldiana]|uniref:Methyltransferase domain-containing protein n=1 Tax=Cercophora newfieldiana TaxID=92897 RepID=A0AA40CRL1_9PEZI|nr:methyltransferase domain-containing protein [Cercophora newfieldiana]